MESNTRENGLRLALYLQDNPNTELNSDEIAALIYRIRCVDDYDISDISIISRGIKVIVDKLINCPINFTGNDWIEILHALSKGDAKNEWKEKVRLIDVSKLISTKQLNIKDKNDGRTIVKTGEQLNVMCESYLHNLALIRRIFSNIFDFNLNDICKHANKGEWMAIKIDVTKLSSKQAIELWETFVYKHVSHIEKASEIAKELILASLARIIICTSSLYSEMGDEMDEETVLKYELTFQLYESLLSNVWLYIIDDKETRSLVLSGFKRILQQGVSIKSRCILALERTSCWLNFTNSEICDGLEEILWDFFVELTLKFLADFARMPLKIEFDAENWLDSMCEKIPMLLDEKQAEECQFHEVIEKTKQAIVTILEFLTQARNKEKLISAMQSFYNDFLTATQYPLAEKMKAVYKSYLARRIISDEDQIGLAKRFIEEHRIDELKAIVECMPEKCTAKQEVARQYMEYIVKSMQKASAEEIESVMGKYGISEELTEMLIDNLKKNDMVKLIKGLIGIMDTVYQKFALNVFMNAFNVRAATEQNPNIDGESDWYLDFESLDISETKWNCILSMISDYETTVMYENNEKKFNLLSIAHLKSSKLNMKEMMYVFRRIDFIRSQSGQFYIKKFYNDDEKIQKLLDDFIQKEHIQQLAALTLNDYIREILESGSNDWVQNNSATELISKWVDPLDLMESTDFVKSLISYCNMVVSWMLHHAFLNESSYIAVESFYCLSRVWQCDLIRALHINEISIFEDIILKEKSRIVLKDNVESHIRRTFLHDTTNLTNKESLKSRIKNQKLCDYLESAATKLIKVCDQLPDPSNTHDSILFSWTIGVSIGGLFYSKEITDKIRQILNGKYGEDMLKQSQKVHVMYYLMAGSTFRPRQKDAIDTININEYYSTIYMTMLREQLITMPKDDNMNKVNDYMGYFTYWADQCAENSSFCKFTNDFMTKFGDLLMDLKFFQANSILPMRDVLLKQVLQCFHLFPKWVQSAECPLTFLASCRRVIDSVTQMELEDKEREKVQKAIRETVDVVLNENTSENLYELQIANIQYSEKRGYSAFNLKLFYQKDDYYEKDDHVNCVKEALNVYAQYGDVYVQKKILGKIAEMMPVLERISQNYKLFEGISNSPSCFNDKKIAIDLLLITELVEYAISVGLILKSENDLKDDDFESFFGLSVGTYRKSKSELKEQAEKSKDDRPKDEAVFDNRMCTFSKTGNNFVIQNWYNCHTCKMTQTTGICTVCVVNCHRGHDVSYSKQGSFFCDCGSGQCASMKEVLHKPVIMHSVRGQYPIEKRSKSSPKIKETNRYQISFLESCEDKQKRDELLNALEKIGEKRIQYQKQFECISDAICKGNENSLKVEEKRNDCLKSFDNLDEIEVENVDTLMESLPKLPERMQFLSTRSSFLLSQRITTTVHSTSTTPSIVKQNDVFGIVRLENGSEIWAMLCENTRSILQMYHMDTRRSLNDGMRYATKEAESLSFAAQRLSVSGNRLVICGKSEVYAIRFSPKGDIVDRAHIKLNDLHVLPATETNPIIKAAWCSNESRQLLAIATQQYVRIYDLTLDMQKFVEEMVLPVGYVEDLSMIEINDEQEEILVVVLCSTGYIYEHVVSEKTANNNSIFLTNVVPHPLSVRPNMSGIGVSCFYSELFDLFFVSHEKGTYFTRLPKKSSEIAAMNGERCWKKLNLAAPVCGWRESGGLISCVETTQKAGINYIKPAKGKLLVQQVPLRKSFVGQVLMESSKNDCVYSFVVYNDIPTIEVHSTNWKYLKDLWIDDIPSENVVIKFQDSSTKPVAVEKEDLAVAIEGCQNIINVDWCCPELEMIYEQSDLNNRLNSISSMPIYAAQTNILRFTAKLNNSNFVVRGIRFETNEHGPASLKVAGRVINVATTEARFFDVIFTREESLNFDSREVYVELIGHPGVMSMSVQSLKLIGCRKEIMDEVRPYYYYCATSNLTDRFCASFLELTTIQLGNSENITELSAKYLNEKVNHPAVSIAATRLIRKANYPDVEKIFNELDGSLLCEWKQLREWTPGTGLKKFRKRYIDRLTRRLNQVPTRWSIFEKNVLKHFGTIVDFVKLLKDEMLAAPLSKNHLIALTLTQMIFAFVAQKCNESNQLIRFYLDLFTNDDTYHLTNELRSSVQISMNLYTMICYHDHGMFKEMVQNGDDEKYSVIVNSGTLPFTGQSRIIENSLINNYNQGLCERMSLKEYYANFELDKEYKWMGEFLELTIEKLVNEGAVNSMPNPKISISDTPSHGLTMVAVAMMRSSKALSKYIETILNRLVIDVDAFFPLNENNLKNFVVFRFISSIASQWSIHGGLHELEKKEQTAGDDKSVADLENNAVLDQFTKCLMDAGILELCLTLIEKVISFWKDYDGGDVPESKRSWLPHVPLIASSANVSNVEVNPLVSTPEHAYRANVAEVAMKLTGTLFKKCGVQFEEDWYWRLCEFACMRNVPGHRTCKKLLISIFDGDKAKYRAMKDKFKMLKYTELLITKYSVYSKTCGGHQQLTEFVDIVSSITSLANSRPEMWREICIEQIAWFLQIACNATDAIACPILELIILAVRDNSGGGKPSVKLADSIMQADNGVSLEKIIMRYLVGKDPAMRWTVHGLFRSVIQLGSRQNQVNLLRNMYLNVYPKVRHYGCHSAQLVDLISTYGPRLFNVGELMKMCDTEMAIVEESAKKIEEQGHDSIYRQMMDLGVGWRTMLFSMNPCLVCFNRGGITETHKLSSIHSDSRFSPNAMIYKLDSNYEISRVVLKIADSKKTKSFRSVSLYYSPKAVEAVVDLKLNQSLWRKCAQTNVQPSDTQITLNVSVPIITSTLIIEFNDIYNIQTSGLHCPRCSASVRSPSGVCENCAENAFQCIKCRSIDYTERDPFLCHTCGFCKHARIEAQVTCRQVPGTHHITSDAERAQSVEEMSKILTRIENLKSKFVVVKGFCEALWTRARPLAPMNVHVESVSMADLFASSNISMFPHNYLHAPVNVLLQTLQNLKAVHEDLTILTLELLALREELRRYDNSTKVSNVIYNPLSQGCYSTTGRCFGCLCANIVHAVALLGSACEDENVQYQLMGMPGLEVICSLSRKYEPLREECDFLLIRMMIDNKDTTKKVERLMDNGKLDVSLFVKSLRKVTDNTWQQKLKYLIRYTMEHDDKNIMCETLMLLNRFLENARPIRMSVYRKMALRRTETYWHTNKIASGNRVKVANYTVATKAQVTKWLTTSDEWNACCIEMPSTSKIPTSKAHPRPLDTMQYKWISKCLFSPRVTVRAAANRLLINLSKQAGHEGVAILLMIENLEKMPDVPSEICDQFVHAAHTIIGASANIKTRLFVEKFHIWLANAIQAECHRLNLNNSDDVSVDHSYGEKLRSLVELLCLMFSGSCVETIILKAAADDLLVCLLKATIFLKRMVIHRTRSIDSSRLALETLLRRVSSKDVTKLMKACVVTINSATDSHTQAHVVSLMLEMMVPQQKAEEDFLIQIEKDAAQEDFLHGRMAGNPYKSSDAGMGPLMRDIKNKICRDTEMIALLEDDNGMELLVNNSIISLSLPVRQVYEKLWRRNNPGQPMVVVYRMRGLMGDAVESFVSTIADESSEDSNEDNTIVAKMTRCLVDVDGMHKLLELLATSNTNSTGRFLLSQLRKLFEQIAKTSIGRQAIVDHRGIAIMMETVRTLCSDTPKDSMHYETKIMLGMEFYKVIELIVADISVHPKLCGIEERSTDWIANLYHMRKRHVKSTRKNEKFNDEIEQSMRILENIMPSLGNVLLGSNYSENTIVEKYNSIFIWETIDCTENMVQKDDTIWIAEKMAKMTENILSTEQGRNLKRKILESGIIEKTCSYLLSKHPPLYSPTESNDWKNFLQRTSLKRILMLLNGLAKGHTDSQRAIAKTTLPLLHRLEQVATTNSIGTLAENVMNALKEDDEVAEKIEAVRLETKQKKRQMAMAMRAKQLTKMGMQLGKSGEVKVASRKIINEPNIDEESDEFICCICRESALRGRRMAGVYAFAATSSAANNSCGVLCTVSQMVMVHLECHDGAVRRGGNVRNTEEWTKASLHNAGARCNVLTPIVTSEVADDSFHAALQRYLFDCEHVASLPGGITRQYVFLDVCQLVERFIDRRSFSLQSQGGGRESNMQYLSILHLLGLSLSDAGEDLQSTNPRNRIVSFLFTELSAQNWNEQKNDILRAAINESKSNRAEITWTLARNVLLTWSFVDKYFNDVIPIDSSDRLQWLRSNLRQTIFKTSRFVQSFDENQMKCESVAEFCDVAGVPRENVSDVNDDPVQQL